MQSITFNSSNQSNSAQIFADVAHWLEVLYAEGHLQNTLSTITSLNNLEEIINYKFKNKLLLLQALTHTSFTHESVGKLNPSYERLEFLGDSILNFIVT